MKRLFITTTILLITGCGLGKTSKSGRKADETDNNIWGSWKTDCIDNSGIKELGKTKRAVVFNNLGDFDRIEYLYMGDQCSDRSLTITVSGTYAVKGNVTEDSEAQKLNLTVDRVKVYPHTKDAADLLNKMNACGIDNWKRKSEEDITGKNCSGYKLREGDVIFDIYMIDENDLYLGTKFSFSSPTDSDRRPKNVNDEIVYKKQ